MDIHTPKLQKSGPSENLEMPQDIRHIGTQFSLLKSHVMREFSVLNQKIYLLSENLEKTLNYMKFQNRNVYLLHENIKILQNDSVQKNKVMRLDVALLFDVAFFCGNEFVVAVAVVVAVVLNFE